MQSYNSDNLPPRPYLVQVLKNCPKSGLLYLDLWNMRNRDNIVFIEKGQIRTIFLTSTLRFRNDLMGLVREGLASAEETPSHYSIELVGWDNDDSLKDCHIDF